MGGEGVGVDLGRVGGGEYDQTTLYEILKGLIKQELKI